MTAPATLDDALFALAELDASGKVKAKREMMEAIVARWPSTPEARAIEVDLARRRVRGRAATAAKSYARAVARAKLETQLRLRALDGKRTGVAAARIDARGVASADEARQRSWAQVREDRPFAALVFAERAVELDRCAMTITFLAARLRAVGDHNSALATYREAWTLPGCDNNILRTGAAAVHADLGHLHLAKKLLRSVLEADPTDPYALNTLGRVQRLCDDLDDAVASLSAAIRDRRQIAGARSELRKVLIRAIENNRTDIAATVQQLLSGSDVSVVVS